MLLLNIGQRLAAACMLFAGPCLFAPLGCKDIISLAMGAKADMVTEEEIKQNLSTNNYSYRISFRGLLCL